MHSRPIVNYALTLVEILKVPNQELNEYMSVKLRQSHGGSGEGEKPNKRQNKKKRMKRREWGEMGPPKRRRSENERMSRLRSTKSGPGNIQILNAPADTVVADVFVAQPRNIRHSLSSTPNPPLSLLSRFCFGVKIRGFNERKGVRLSSSSDDLSQPDTIQHHELGPKALLFITCFTDTTGPHVLPFPFFPCKLPLKFEGMMEISSSHRWMDYAPKEGIKALLFGPIAYALTFLALGFSSRESGKKKGRRSMRMGGPGDGQRGELMVKASERRREKRRGCVIDDEGTREVSEDGFPKGERKKARRKKKERRKAKRQRAGDEEDGKRTYRANYLLRLRVQSLKRQVPPAAFSSTSCLKSDSDYRILL
ncbi:hypothetical protein BDN70DRAFT_901301 [Pholiota conissans]|uniref:Uncharacterized protein n=1 Tax=Pholiota conissans TaxID=109636 RepID=A0A9P5YLI8_9AGAR|nr:hypothetical protein BDN70DRAFT_901301 [Pholiota conissans]